MSIEARITNFLKARRVPSHIKDDASRDELLRQIVRVVENHAPDHDVEAWVGKIIEKATVLQKGLGWPTPDIWAKAVGQTNYNAKREEIPASEKSLADRAFDAFVRRINDGEPVDENMLFGRTADRALREQAVLFDTIRRYQIGAYMAWKKRYGRDVALQRMDDRNPTLAQWIRDQIEEQKAAPAEARLPHAADAGDDFE